MIPIWYDRFKYHIISLCYWLKTGKTPEIRGLDPVCISGGIDRQKENIMADEEKGFVIKDRRAFDDKGEVKGEAPKEEPQREETKKRTPEDRRVEMPLPEVNFNSLIFSLSSSALINLGEIADPNTGQKQKDLPLAKHTIDTIAMLQDKTKGNLNTEEQRFLDTILADLRWRYVKLAE